VTEIPAISAPATPRPAWWAGPWPLVVLCFAWCLFFYTRNYAHPYYYEKDATTKVQQVKAGDRNYFHPLLMLNTADTALKVSGTPRTEQSISDVGHLVMAWFGALSVAAFVLFGYRCGGWVSAVAVGLLVSLNALLLTLTNYFKEDPALLIGVALSFLAMKYFDERPTLRRAGLLGAACAVAIAGKYVGVAMLILAIVLVLIPPGRRFARLGVLLGVGVVVLLAIDWQWVVDFQALRHGFHTEMHDLLEREQMVKKVPHIRQVVETYHTNLPFCLALGVLWQIIHLSLVNGRRRVVEWMLLAYPLTFTVVLAWSPRLFERHFLPVFICLWASSALGWVNAARWLWQRFPRLPASATAGALVFVVICALRIEHDFFHRQRDLATDHRALMAAWIRDHVPAEAVIAQDRRVYLTKPDGSPRPELGLPQRIVTVGWLSDVGSYDELRKQGVSHVAMHKLDSGRYMPGGKFDEEALSTDRYSRDSAARRAFYGDLKAHAQLLWEHGDGDDGAMNPALLFYALDPEK
jgi:hypothetical protein